MEKILPVYISVLNPRVPSPGNLLLTSPRVPEGETHVITHISAFVGAFPVGLVVFEIHSGGKTYHTKLHPTLEIDKSIEFNGVLILEPGDIIYWRFNNCKIGTSLHGIAAGYKHITE